MPALPDVPAVFRVYLGYTIGADTTNVTRLFFKYSGGPPTNAGMTSWANGIASQWNTTMAALTYAGTILTGVRCTDLSTTTSPDAAITTNHPGTRTGGGLPAGVAFLVNYVPNRRYRGGKPRSYLPIGTGTDVATLQTWAPAFVTSVTNAWQSFLTNMMTVGIPSGVTAMHQVNVSYYQGWTPEETSTGRPYAKPKVRAVAQVDDITSMTFDPNFASQRRRER